MLKLLLSVDTEADDCWGLPSATSAVDNIEHVPRLQTLCEAFGIRPTYLVTYEVATSTVAQETLSAYVRSGNAEVGAHLHVWTTPPLSAADRAGEPGYATELPKDALADKVRSLTTAITHAFDGQPTSFRSGRYGIDGRLVRVLEEAGYSLDCSVTPGIDWGGHAGYRGGQGGPDHTRAPVVPYHPSYDDVCGLGTALLLEIPITIVRSRALATLRMGLVGARSVRGLARAGRRALRRPLIWFRPLPQVSLADLLFVVGEAERGGLPCIHMAFHSSDLMAGGSPYAPDQGSVEDLYRKLEGLFRTIEGRCEPMLLREFAHAYSARAQGRRDSR